MPSEVQPLNLEQAIQMLADAFNEPVSAVQADKLRDDIQGWDSMGVLMLTAELDDRFGVELASETSREMRSIADVLDFLRARQLLKD